MVEAVKLMRCPIDTNCSCGKLLEFGVWVYFNPETEEALCIDCAVKRGWTPKDRVNQIIRKMELQEDIKALAKQRKIETNALLLLREEIDLHRLGERDLELEGEILKLMQKVEEYMTKVATPEEKEGLEEIFAEIRRSQELQKEIRLHIQERTMRLERKKKVLDQKLIV